MSGAYFAVLAAICFALSYVATTFGLKATSAINGVVISLVASSAVSAGALMLDWPGSWSLPGLVLFGLGGLVAPGISRLTSMRGVDALGPSIAVPLQSGVRPLLAVVAGAVILGEQIGALRLGAAVAVSLGLAGLARAMRRPGPNPSSTSGTPLAIAYPLLTGVLFAAADVFKKEGLGYQSDPLLAALVSTLAATFFWTGAVAVWGPLRRSVRPREGTWWFLLAGTMIALANIALMYALRAGDVSVVGPISSTSPLVVFALSAVFLRDIETLQARTIGWGVMVVAGTALLAIS